MVNQVLIQVANVAQLITLGFTKVEVWASADQGNSFQELTSPAASPAVLLSKTAQTTFQMGGRLLKFSVDGGPEVSVPFGSGLASWTPAQVAAQINTVLASVATASGGKVSLTSTLTGRRSSVVVTYCDATDLFNTGDSARGTDARLTLSGATKVYPYTDLGGLPFYIYKYRFSANGANPVSNFSTPVLPSPVGSVSTVYGTGTFVDLNGNPTRARLLIGMVSLPRSVSSSTILPGTTQAVDADENGFLQVALVPGSTIRVAIEGTTIVRELVVPSSDFDFLTVLGTATDGFTVQVVPPFLTRRST
jgi:hypothetical protein